MGKNMRTAPFRSSVVRCLRRSALPASAVERGPTAGRLHPPVAALAAIAALALACLTLATKPAFCGWQTFSQGEGLATNDVRRILEDHAGNLWFATGGGVSRYDGATWRTFTTVDGLASDDVLSIL